MRSIIEVSVALIVATLSVPLTVVNLFGGMAAAIWLAYIGQWKPLGLGIVIFLASGLIVTLLMIPTMIVGALAVLANKFGGKSLVAFFALLTYLCTPAALIGWGYLMLTIFPRMGPPEALIPLLLWSYGAATGPWVYMLHKSRNEPDPDHMWAFHITCFSLGYVAAILVRWLADASSATCLWILIGFSTVASLQGATLATDRHRQRKLEEEQEDDE